MAKTPFVTKEKVEEIAEQVKTRREAGQNQLTGGK